MKPEGRARKAETANKSEVERTSTVNTEQNVKWRTGTMVRNKRPVAGGLFSATKPETAELPEVAYRFENCRMLVWLIIQNKRPVAVAYKTFEFQTVVI